MSPNLIEMIPPKKKKKKREREKEEKEQDGKKLTEFVAFF